MLRRARTRLPTPAVRVLAARGGADLGQVGRAGVRVPGQVRHYRLLFPLISGLGLAAPDQQLPARPDALLEQPLDDVRSTMPARPSTAAPFPAHSPGGSPAAV